MGPGKDVFGWPSGDVRLSVLCSVGWGVGVGQATRTGVAGRVEPSGTVTEAWPVWSYAPTPSAYATAARVCDRVFPNRVDERDSEKRVPRWRLNTGRRLCCCCLNLSHFQLRIPMMHFVLFNISVQPTTRAFGLASLYSHASRAPA